MLRAPELNNFLRSSFSLLLVGRTNSATLGSSSSFQTTARRASTASSARKRGDIKGTPKRPKSSAFNQHQHSYFSTYVSKYFHLTPGEVESFLNRHRIKYRCSDTEARIEECPFCHPTRGEPDNLYALSVERSTGAFMCHRCRINGKWFDLKSKFSAGMIGPMLTYEKEGETQKHSEDAKPVAQEKKPTPSRKAQESFVRNLWNREDSNARSYLNEKRGLKDEVLKKYGVGCSDFDIIVGRDWRPKEPCITFPMYDGNDKLVRHKIRPIETKSGMRLSPKGGSWGLFGLTTVPSDARCVVITEGEFDAMAVYQTTGRPAISVPNGASSLPLELLPFLERFDRIFLWMDEDEPGQTGAETFSRKLGLKRCLSVRGLHVEGKPCKDANDGLLRDIDLEALIQRAKVIQHSGIVKFQDIRDQVLADLNNIEDPNAIKSQSIPRLHELMKGLRPGELTILSGPTGCGKTTLLSQLSLDFCVQNVPTLWGSFEMDNARLAGKLLLQFHAVYNKGKSNLLDKFDYWADRFSELPFYFMRYHGSNPVEHVIEAMEYAHYMYDCRHVLLDNLQFMSYGQRAGFHQRQFEVMDNAVAQLREFCTRRKVHITLVVHPRKTEDDDKLQIASVYGSAKATQEADNVLILQRTTEGRLLEVRKNRFDGSVGGIPLKFDKKRLMFSQGDSCGGWLGWDSEKKIQGDSKLYGDNERKTPGPDSKTPGHSETKIPDSDCKTLGDSETKSQGAVSKRLRGAVTIELGSRGNGGHDAAARELEDGLDVQGEDKYDGIEVRKPTPEEDGVNPLETAEECREGDTGDGERNNRRKGSARGGRRRVRRHVMKKKQLLRSRRGEEDGGWEGMGTRDDGKLFSPS